MFFALLPFIHAGDLCATFVLLPLIHHAGDLCALSMLLLLIDHAGNLCAMYVLLPLIHHAGDLYATACLWVRLASTQARQSQTAISSEWRQDIAVSL